MGFMHIENLYKNQTILQFRECWALEKRTAELFKKRLQSQLRKRGLSG